NEIEYLSTQKRREVAERIKIAREFGDITENAEYDDAKNEQAMLEARIAKLEERIAAARVIEKKEIAKDVVSVGAKVRLRDVDAKQTVEYHIVGGAEASKARLRGGGFQARTQWRGAVCDPLCHVRALHGARPAGRRPRAGRGPRAQAQLHRHRAPVARAPARGGRACGTRARVAGHH